MVALDDHALSAQAGLHHIGIDGTLSQEVHRADFLGLFLKDPDEFLADDLPLVLRLGNASQLAQEARSRVDAAHIHVELMLHHLLHMVSLVLPQQSVVHKNARQLIAHRPLQKRCRHRAVHAAGQRQKHAAVADLPPALRHGFVQIGRHGPLGTEAADLVQEVFQHLHTVLRVLHLRVELHTIQLPIRVFHSGAAATVGGRDDLKARGDTLHLHAVAHPAHGRLRHTGKQGGGRVGQLDLAILPRLRLAALTAQQLHHQLLSVADAQHGDAHFKQRSVHHGGVGLEHGGGAAGEDQRIWPKGADIRHAQPIGLDLAVYAALTDTPCHQQVILPAEIQNQHLFHVSRPPGSGSRRSRRCR